MVLDACQFNEATEDTVEQSERETESNHVSADAPTESWASDTLASLNSALVQAVSRIRYLRGRAAQLRHSGDDAARLHEQTMADIKLQHEEAIASLTNAYQAQTVHLFILACWYSYSID